MYHFQGRISIAFIREISLGMIRIPTICCRISFSSRHLLKLCRKLRWPIDFRMFLKRGVILTLPYPEQQTKHNAQVDLKRAYKDKYTVRNVRNHLFAVVQTFIDLQSICPLQVLTLQTGEFHHALEVSYQPCVKGCNLWMKTTAFLQDFMELSPMEVTPAEPSRPQTPSSVSGDGALVKWRRFGRL